MNKSTYNLYKGHPFILEQFSEEMDAIKTEKPEKNLLFGTGLTTREYPSLGLPFDFIAYMLTAEELRRHHGLNKIIHIIGDSHALTNKFVDPEHIKYLAKATKEQLTKAAIKLGIASTYQVQLVSEIQDTKEFKAIYEEAGIEIDAVNLPKDALGYFQGQLTDMEYFVRHHNAVMKMSWLLDPKRAFESKGYDERAFDRAYSKVFGANKLSLVYTVCGYTADPKRFRASPYTYIEDERRVLMSSEFDIDTFMVDLNSQNQSDDKAAQKAASNVLNHMQSIVKQYEVLFAKVEANDLAGKIKKIAAIFEAPLRLQSTKNIKATFNDNQRIASNESSERINMALHDKIEIIEPKEGLKDKLQKKRPLVVKLGFDPTAPDLHLGHAVILKKMREFQDNGHKIVIIIGDYTARIGDPTGRNDTRPELSDAQIKENAQTYVAQLHKILNVQNIEVKFNSEWFGRKNMADVLKLMGQTTLAQLLERNDFSNRYKQGLPIHMHEMLYPLMQGTDSVEIKADIEMGGTDQLFNNMMGRHLQERFGQEGQVVLCMPILPGLDGVEKMSKSKNNYVGLTEAPEQMYGKIMSIPDSVLPEYIDLVTDLPFKERQKMKQQLIKGDINPIQLKMTVAFNVVKQYHDQPSAKYAADYFDRNVRNRSNDNKDFREIGFSELANEDNVASVMDICRIIRPNESNNQIRKLISGGALKVDGAKVLDVNLVFNAPEEDIEIQFGKRGLLKIKSDFPKPVNGLEPPKHKL